MATHPWATIVWLFVLGTIIGSFLNVVIYRLPRGMSLASPGSRCPECKHPIRWYDNVPVLGWIVLGGRCRDCKAGISICYPLVEATVGILFAVFAWIDLVRPAEAREVAQLAGAVVEKVGDSPEQTDGARYVYHLLFLVPLLAAALIDADGQRLPRRLITWPTSGGILMAFAWPAAQLQQLVWPRFDTSLGALSLAILGLLAAAALRIGTQRCLGPFRPRELGLWNATLAVYAVGAYLGWISVLVIGNLMMLWTFVSEGTSASSKLRRIRPTMIVFVAALAWCLIERPIAERIFGS